MSIDDCASSPCVSGLCLDGLVSFACLSCHSSHCHNGGSCSVSTVRGLECICPVGFSGSECSFHVDSCGSSPCFHGECLETSTALCLCNSGFTGPQCQTNVNDCSLNVCMDGSVCVDGVNSHVCVSARVQMGVHAKATTAHVSAPWDFTALGARWWTRAPRACARTAEAV